MGCCSRSRDEWTRQLTGISGAVVFWGSVGSIVMGIHLRHQCVADLSVLPMLLLPTGVVGIFASAFVWMYLTFLWNDDTYDFMKYLTYITGIIAGIMQFVTFGFSLSMKFLDPNCHEPFWGYSLGLPLSLGVIVLTITILNIVHRVKIKREMQGSS